jgi:hypothetical protein
VSTRLRGAGAICVGTLAVFLFAGATNAEPNNNAVDNLLSAEMSDDQRASVEDRTVTRDEYDAGFRRFSSCLEEKGFALLNVREAFQVLTYGVPEDAVQSGAEEECYSREFAAVDTLWQVSVEDVGEYSMIWSECLKEAGLDSTGTKADKESRLESAGISIDECLDSRQ